MSYRSTACGESGRLAMGGSLTIENAVRIREELIKAFRASDSVVLELLEDVVVDVSFMQILSAAKKTAVIEKKRFHIDWSSAPAVRQSVGHAGCICEELCFSDADDDRRSISGGPDE